MFIKPIILFRPELKDNFLLKIEIIRFDVYEYIQ